MKKIFKRSIWCLLTVFFAVCFVIVLVGGNIAKKNDSFVNGFFNVQDYIMEETDEGEPFNEYKSDYVNEDGTFNDKAMRDHSLDVALRTATEGTVLLENKNDALPLAKDSKISIFGISSSKYLLSPAGSGHLGVTLTTNIQEACESNGLKVNPKLSNAYTILGSKYGNYLTDSGTTISGSSIGDKCYVEYGINEAPYNELDKTSVGLVTNSFKEYGDAAIYYISRNDGEDGDTNYYTPESINGNYLDLAIEEVNILNKLMELKSDGTFKKVILMINAAMPLQMKTIKTYDLDALVWLGVGGNVSFDQIGAILSGNAEPSGHLPDTYLYDNYSAPSTVNFGDFTFENKSGLPATEQYTHNDKYLVYQEGIYIGYRYFETRYEDTVLKQGNADSSKGSVNKEGEAWKYENEVAYPFGYGLSYTEFEYSGYKMKETVDATGYNISLTVTNIGDRPGKDVVQVYLQKPYTQYDIDNKIEKASVELVGYDKTKLLDPNDSEEITIFVPKEEFKTYDAYNKGTYILEKGDYYLTVGEDSHDAINNILAKKGMTTSDGMDEAGDSNKASLIRITDDDFERYSTSLVTGYEITNQFTDADPNLYEGTKDQFKDFKYLSRSDWDGTYPVKVKMDVTTDKMRQDFQYTAEIVEDPEATMPIFGQSSSKTLISMWGLDYDDPSWNDLLNQVTWEEAVTLATYGGGTAGCVSVAAPSGLAKDGPGGIGVGNENLPNVMAFPSECNMAATFNDELIEELGNAFGMEILHVGYTGIYGPGANIHRSAFSGRNWEYYSEDPFISGQMLEHEVRGLQNRGVIVFTKHFLLNDQERNRYGVSIWANEQSIREIYLKAFEGGVVDGKMNGIMSSFNRIGATWAGKHKGLLTNVLRKEWGFIGVVQTDAYVGTHMHRCLAESIIAGNDFTMGGSNPTALDSYRDSPTLASALRETVHRILYTKLHSNAMNGMKLTTKIIYVTPWWKTTLDALAITFGVLAIICFLIFAVSVTLPFLDKRKKRLESLPEYQGKKVSYFFDVITKKATVITSCIALVLIVVSISVPLAINSAGRSHSNPNISAGSNEPYEPECEHKCATCGLCIDYSSELEECKEKCGGHLKNTQTFEGEDSHVLLYGGDRGALGTAQEEGSSEVYIGGFNANLGAKIKYVITAPQDLTATLFVSVCKRSSPLLFTSSVLVQVNGEIVQSKGVVSSLASGEAEWVNFIEVCLGCIQLNEGRNTITFTVANDDAACGFNFDSISIKSDYELSWYEGPHICDDICQICGLCMNDKCEDPVCEDKCTCNLPKQTFALTDKKAEILNAELVGDKVTFDNADEEVIYQLKSEADTNAVLFLDMNINEEKTVDELFEIKVNDKVVTFSDVAIEASEEKAQIKLGQITLSYGINTVSIKTKTASKIDFYGITIGCEDTLTYPNPYEFSAISNYVQIEGNAYRSTENCIAMNENAMGSIITFPINSSKETTADLFINIASRATPAKISDILRIKVNDVEITTDADLPNIGSEFFTYSDVLINTINLVEGYNEITFEVLTNNESINTNLKYISFENTDAELSFAQMPSGAYRLVVEAENVTITPITYNGAPYPYVASGQNASGDQYLGGMNDAGLYAPGQAKLSFKVSASEDMKFKLYFACGISGNASASSYTVNINGETNNSTQSWSASDWYDWKEQYYGNLDLNSGENTIEIVIEKNEPINLDYFVLESNAEITLL